MNIPMISIIVPVYNTEQYLQQCLNSICGQTFSDIEIICVDDGSTDDSGGILDEFASKDDRLIVIHRESASGSAALSRNMGLDIARGKYVMFLDSDDYFDEHMLEFLLNKAEKTGADLVMCDNYNVMSSGELNIEHTELHEKYLPDFEVFSYRDIPETIFQISNAAVWHKLILRGQIEKFHLRFQENLPVLDDIFFVNSILVLSDKITIIRDRLIYYRYQRDGAQTKNIHRHKKSIFIAFDALNRYLKKFDIYETVKVSLQNWTLTTMRWWLYSCETYNAFAEVFSMYQEWCFKELGLMDMAEQERYDVHNEQFYVSVLKRDKLRSAEYAISSVLKIGSKIVIYGAGKVGKKIHDEILSEDRYKICLWCDKNADNINDSRVRGVETLSKCDYDALFIAIGDYHIVEAVKKDLFDMGVEEGKIYIA